MWAGGSRHTAYSICSHINYRSHINCRCCASYIPSLHHASSLVPAIPISLRAAQPHSPVPPPSGPPSHNPAWPRSRAPRKIRSGWDPDSTPVDAAVGGPAQRHVHALLLCLSGVVGRWRRGRHWLLRHITAVDTAVSLTQCHIPPLPSRLYSLGRVRGGRLLPPYHARSPSSPLPNPAPFFLP